MRIWRDAQRDARHGMRTLGKSPGFTLVTIAALAVGIGANLTIFGFVNALLLRPLPAMQPNRLVRADLGGPNPVENHVAYEDYVEYRDRNQTLTHLALFHPGGVLPVRVDRRIAEPIHVLPVTGNYFETLGVRAAVGRTLASSDDQVGAGAVVLSHEGWTRHFAADPEIVGRTILIQDVPFAVVGITAEEFTGTAFPVIPRMYASWKALRQQPGAARGYMIGRLAADASQQSAQADFARIAAQLRSQRNQPVTVAVYPATTSMPGVQRAFSLFAALFMVIVGAVLWSACSNVAILQLVRSNARRREMAIRLAMGATRPQLVRQLLMEAMLLGVMAGTLGVGLAIATARWLTQIPLPVPMPIGLTFEFDWRVGMFAIAVSLSASLLCGLGAALDARLTQPAGVLRQETGTAAGRFPRQSLVVTQVALTTVLLVVAVSMARSLIRPPAYGLDERGVLMATVALPQPQYSGEQARLFFQRLLEVAGVSPGVESATLVETIPLAINRPLSSVEVAIDDTRFPPRTGVSASRLRFNHVSPGHFRTLGIRLIAGRDFRPQDDERSSGVVIVNESAAKRFWPGESALGKTLRLGTAPVTIVGIAGDSKYDSLSDEGQPFVYKPFAQAAAPLFEGTLFIKSSDPSAAATLVRSTVATLDPSLAVSNLNAFEERLGLTLLPNRAVAVTSGFLGLIALGLGTIGTYSVMAFLVLQRRREIGIRIALGAMPRGVVAMITGQGIRWTVIGLAIGVAAAIGAMQLIEGLIVGVSGSDPVPVLLVVLLLGSVGALACFLPSRQAGTADPIAVLRE